MSVRNLGFRDLQYMVAVAELRSFSRAAIACAITQPALSERIKRIESSLDVLLFERTKRSLKVTPVGERLMTKARQLLDELRAVEDIIASSHEPLSGPLRLGVIATLGPYLMPYLLPPLRQSYPKLALNLQEGLTEPLLEALKAGSLDVVIAAAPIDRPGLTAVELFYEPFVLASPVGHPISQRQEITPGLLRGDEMVLLEEGHCLSGQALEVCPAKRRDAHHRLHAMSLETLRHMVASGAGYTLLPWLAVGSRPPLRKLIRYAPLETTKRYGRRIVAVYRESFSRESDITCLAELIQASLPDELKQESAKSRLP